MSTQSPGEFYPEGLAPGLPAEPVTAGGLTVSRQPLTPAALGALTRGLSEQYHLNRALPIHRIIQELATVHARWAATGSELRAEAVTHLHSTTGYAEASIDAGLQKLFAKMDASSLEAWLVRSGVPLPSLDHHQEVADGMLTFGPRLTVVISSGNVPGAALPSLVQTLLLKSPCLVKTASSEPVLLPLYVNSLAAQCPELTQAIAVTGWLGGDPELERVLLAKAEALIAYGSDETIRSLRDRLPVRTRFIGYGHRLSFTAIARELLQNEALAREAAERAALDLGLFDQQGCYSPQAVFIERNGTVSPERFGALMAEALEALASQLPRRVLPPAESAGIHQYRGSVEMRMFGDPSLRIWASAGGTRWTVVLESSAELSPCPLNRTAVLRPIDDLDALPELIEGRQEFLLAVALGASDERYRKLAGRLGEVGLARITRLGNAQLPDDALYHDGSNAIAALARFTVVE